MSRGGRRRRRRGRRPEKPGEQQGAGTPTAEASTRKLPRRRRKGAARPAPGKSVLESMSSRPAVLTTLPPDGLVLEKLIEELQDEYGTPATPQEYRLIIRVASGDEPRDLLVETEPPDTEEPLDPGEAQQAVTRVQTRKRRGRRRGTGPDGSPGTDPSPAAGSAGVTGDPVISLEDKGL